MKIDDTEIEEYKFYQRNSPILINRIDINEIVLSSIKYIIGYKDDKKIRPLFIFFPKMNTYRIFGKNDCMHFMMKEKNIFDKYNEIWKKSQQYYKRNLTVNLYTIKII